MILSLYDKTTNMLHPWANAGYDCWAVDIQHPPGFSRGPDNILRIGMDIRAFETWWFANNLQAEMTFSFSPCDHLAVSGARWWAAKGPNALAEGLELFDIGMRIIGKGPGMAENPVGRLSTYRRKPDFIFQPNWFGDPYQKLTCIWTVGSFIIPKATPERRVQAHYSLAHRLGSRDKARRSITPEGFAKAVYEDNHAKIPIVWGILP